MKPNAKISWRRAVPALMLALAIAFALPQKARAQEEFKRDIEQISFVPKGQWITGVSVSYTQSSQDNYQFLVVENLNGDAYTFKVSPMVMYVFKDNLAAGGRVAYSRQRVKLDQADVVLGEDTNYNVDHLYSISHSYSVAGAFRNYISLGNSTRFGIFNEVQLQIGGGQSKLEKGQGVDYTGTYEKNFNLNIGVAPGMVMFLNNYSAIEVNVGVLGFDYRRTKSTTDRIYVAHRDSKSGNFRINLFSITFGCTFYI
ncbi:MAG: hypothetical protein ACI4US_00315 [Muribaculaceae bacterium]